MKVKISGIPKAESGTKLRVKIKGVPQAENGITTLWGGKSNEESENPYTGNTVKFDGASHDDGGIGISYMGNPVEVEGQEYGFRDRSGDFNVFGNMKVPGTDQKFKNVAKNIANGEQRATRLNDKAINVMDDNDPNNSFQALSFNSGLVMQDAAKQKQKVLADKKEELADIQNMLLAISKQSGKEPKEVAKQFKNGGYIPIADDGQSIAVSHHNPGNLKYSPWMKKYGAVPGKAGSDGGYFANFPDTTSGQNAMQELLSKPLYSNKTVEQAVKTWTGGGGYNTIPEEIKGKKVGDLQGQQRISLLNAITQGEDSKSYNWDNIPTGTPGFDSSIQGPPEIRRFSDTTSIQNPPREKEFIEKIPSLGLRTFETPSVPTTYESPVTTPTNINQSIINPKPKIQPSLADRNKFQISSILGDIPKLFDRPDFVKGQQYNPQLMTPYQVSYQDRLNQNQSDFRAIERQLPNNPEALSALAAQKYQANNQVLGDQFRFNQGVQNQVENQNAQIQNDAQLKNLQFADQQYVRQQQAKSITNARRDEALADITNKYMQNRSENNNIRLMENMFNYRPDQNLNLQYTGGPASFNFPGGNPGIGGQQNLAGKKVIYKYDKNNQPISYTVIDDSDDQDTITREKARKAEGITSRKWGGLI